MHGNDSILIVATRRISRDDNPATSRASPILNLKAIRHKGSKVHHELAMEAPVDHLPRGS
jgi:hypothetical protein